MDIVTSSRNVRSREDLSSFVSALLDDFLERGEDWENCTLESYLRSFSVCVLEIRNAMENNNESVPEEATWEHFARILMMATYYE